MSPERDQMLIILVMVISSENNEKTLMDVTKTVLKKLMGIQRLVD